MLLGSSVEAGEEEQQMQLSFYRQLFCVVSIRYSFVKECLSFERSRRAKWAKIYKDVPFAVRLLSTTLSSKRSSYANSIASYLTFVKYIA
jgi:hypothetical protein